MMRIRTALMFLAAILLGAALAGPVHAAVACHATGDAWPTGDGSVTYCVTLEWGFKDYVPPERIAIMLDNLVDCEFYNPEGPIQSLYIQPGPGTSTAAEGCGGGPGLPTQQIAWVGEVAFEDPNCWGPTLHIAYTNTGPTAMCDPLPDDTGTFYFKSYGLALPVYTYYGIIVIRAGDTCVYCDYTGPLPDCNMWSPVSQTSWGTIKGLYR